jgi:cell division protein FtsI (penicillin-binding protein 3)
MAGLEMKYDLELNGKPGAVRKLGFRRWSLHEKILTPPVQGRSLVLSIDSGLQNLTQRELVSEIRRSKALAGTAIVMESETGRILALANFPDFNCSTYGQFGHARWKNSAVQDQFEPGAPVKAILAAACLEEKLTKPGEIIDCQMGSITVGRHVYHDARPHGRLTFEQIFEQSSIVGAIKLGMRLGPERLHRSLLSFGFGSRTKIDLPTEIEGSIHDPRRWSGLSLASISFGQEIAATPIQTITAINAIANGGYRVRPSVVDRVVDNSGATVRMNKPERIRLMHSETAASMRNALEGVVLRGAGKRASLEGYRTAGINSNAQKVVAGYYSKTKYVASFVGFAPLPAPRVTVLVQIDEPEEALCGGDVAARVFQKIAQPALYNLPQSSK